MIKAKDSIKDIKAYSAGKPIDETKREYGLDEVYKLASNENPLGPPPSAVEAMIKHAGEVNYYPDANFYYLKEALSKKFNVPMSQLVIGNGSNELIKLLSLVYLEEGCEIISAGPSFGEYLRSAKVASGDFKVVTLDENFVHDLTAMAAAINEKTKLVYICNPNNPTGTVITNEAFADFMKKVPSDVLVILDEAYYEFQDPEVRLDSFKFYDEYENIVILRTFSKAYGLAGMRVGYGIAREEIIGELDKVREPFNTTSLGAVAAIAALNDTDYIEKSYKHNKEQREFLVRELKAMGLKVYDTHTNFMMVDIKEDSRPLFIELLKRGIIVRTADIFGYPEMIRVSVGLHEHNVAFLKALRELLNK